jgi:tetratricopeptide (TPR) repeat protein
MSKRRDETIARLKQKLQKNAIKNATECGARALQLQEKETLFEAGKAGAGQKYLTFLEEAAELAEQIRDFIAKNKALLYIDMKPLDLNAASCHYAVWQVRMAEEYFFQDKFEHAFTAAHKAERLEHPYCYYILGRLNEQRQQFTNAREYYAKVLRFFAKPADFMEHRFLGQAQLQLGYLDSEDDGDHIAAEKAYLSAIENLKQAKHPTALCDAYRRLGTLYAEGSVSVFNPTKAYACFDEVIAMNDWYGYLFKATTMLLNEERSPANLALIEANLINACALTNNPYPHFQLGAFYDAQGRKELAVKHYKICGEYPAALHNLSYCYSHGEGMEKPDPDASLACLRLAYEKFQHVGAAIDLANILFTRGDKASIREAQKALRFAKQQGAPMADYTIAYYIHTKLWPTQRPLHDAMHYFTLAAEKGVWEAQMNCAMFFIFLDDFPNAQRWLQRAVTHPNNGGAAFFLANYILKLIHEYEESPSHSLHKTINFLEQALTPFLALPQTHEVKAMTFENFTEVKCEGIGQYASVKVEYESKLAEFKRKTLQQFKSLNRKLCDTQQDDDLTPLYKLQAILEDILQAQDANLINILTALHGTSQIVSQHRFDPVFITRHFDKLIALYKLLAGQENTVMSVQDAANGLLSLSKFHFASRVHDDLHCLDWLLPKLLDTLEHHPEPQRITEVICALHRLANTRALLTVDLSRLLQAAERETQQFSVTQLTAMCYSLSVMHNQFHFANTQNKSGIAQTLKVLVTAATLRVNCSELPEASRHAWYLTLSYAEKFQFIKANLIGAHKQYYTEHPAHLLCREAISGSLLQEDITEFLTRFYKKAVKSEHPVRGLIVDLYLDQSLDSVIIHVDGPGHYFFDPQKPASELTAKDRFRDTLLGKRVVHISYLEWESCTTDALRAKLLLTKFFSLQVKIPPALLALREDPPVAITRLGK